MKRVHSIYQYRAHRIARWIEVHFYEEVTRRRHTQVGQVQQEQYCKIGIHIHLIDLLLQLRLSYLNIKHSNCCLITGCNMKATKQYLPPGKELPIFLISDLISYSI